MVRVLNKNIDITVVLRIWTQNPQLILYL